MSVAVGDRARAESNLAGSAPLLRRLKACFVVLDDPCGFGGEAYRAAVLFVESAAGDDADGVALACAAMDAVYGLGMWGV